MTRESAACIESSRRDTPANSASAIGDTALFGASMPRTFASDVDVRARSRNIDAKLDVGFDVRCVA